MPRKGTTRAKCYAILVLEFSKSDGNDLNTMYMSCFLKDKKFLLLITSRTFRLCLCRVSDIPLPQHAAVGTHILEGEYLLSIALFANERRLFWKH